MFSDLQMIRYNKAGTAELERILVPIVYGQKEKWMLRNKQDPELTRSIEIQLPRMSFEFTGFNYDPSRKFNPLLKNRSNNGLHTQSKGIPYDFHYSLTLLVRNIEDGSQIVEQIIPMFSPDYTLSLNLIEDMDFTQDIPVILNDTQFSCIDEGNGDDTRVLTWQLDFTVKGYLYGPVSNATIIKRANTNFYNDLNVKDRITVLILQGGSGQFKDGEFVFQGDTLETSDAKAELVEFDSENQKLYIRNNDSVPFRSNVDIMGFESGAQYNVGAYYISTSAVAWTTITPNPSSAMPGYPYGFNIQLFEINGGTTANNYTPPIPPGPTTNNDLSMDFSLAYDSEYLMLI